MTFQGEASRRSTFAEVADRAGRLASGLRRLGVGPGRPGGDAVLEPSGASRGLLRRALPGRGAAHPEPPPGALAQLDFVINHGGDRVIIVDASLAAPAGRHPAGPGDRSRRWCWWAKPTPAGLGEVIDYEELIAGSAPLQDWPELDERQAAAMCYTTGTTGDPKGVVYSHRSIWLHSFAVTATFAYSDADRICLIVPDVPRQRLGDPVQRLDGRGRHAPPRALSPTGPAALLHPPGAAHLRRGAFPPSSRDCCSRPRGLRPRTSASSAWGLRRLGGADQPDAGLPALVPSGPVVGDDRDQPHRGRSPSRPGGWLTTTRSYWHYRSKTGRPAAGVELRIVGADDEVLPWDGQAVGEIEVRGPWVTGQLFRS